MLNGEVKEIITDIEVLSERCDEIDPRKQGSLVQEIVLNLKKTMRSIDGCMALAAPQIGYPWRVFCLAFTNGDIKTFINPILSEAKGLTMSKEKSLSLPGKEYIRPRCNDIKVIYSTPTNEYESRELKGLAAEIFQQMVDQLDGLLLSDVGLEIDEDWYNATDDERAELLKAYMEALDIRQAQLEKEVEENPELKQIDDAIDFIDEVVEGKTNLVEENIEVISANKG